MRDKIYAVLIVSCFFHFIGLTLQSQTLKILPLGNSLTKGVFCNNGTITNCEVLPDSRMIGYRFALYQSLLNAGYEFEFVGNEHAGDYYFSIQYSRHAGYPGYTSNALRLKLNDNNNFLLNYNMPDVVLLEIGTNDIMAGISAASFAAELNNILNEIDEYEIASGKSVLVFLSKIIKFKQGALYGENVATFNTSLQNVYNTRKNAGDNIQLLDVGSTLSNLQEPAGDMKDELHPNQGGYDKMAAQWFQAINTYNSAPVPAQIPNQQVAEDNAFSVISLDNYIYDAEDPDNMITWTVSPEPQHYTVTINASRQAVIVPKNADWNGSETITFIAADRGKIIAGLRKKASISASFTVLPVNDPPVIAGQTRIPVTPEETSYTIVLSDLNVTDIDNPQTDLTVQVLSGSNYSFTGSTITPAVDFCGSLPVSIRVNDLSSSSQVYSFILNVSAVNDPPIINSANVRSIDEDTPLKLRLTDYQVTDPDNFYPADFALTIGNGQNYSHNGDTVIPVPDFFGTLEVSVMVRDLLDQSNTFIHEITVMPVNDPPVLIIPANNSVVEGNLLELQLEAYDPDESDPLQITAVSLPTWLTHNSLSGKLSGIPLHQNVGNNPVTLRVNDSHISVDSTFLVEVLLGTALNDYETKGFAVYPNPASTNIHVKLKPGSFVSPLFKIYNTNGKLVLEEQVNTDDFTINVDEHSLNAGIYIYEISEKQVIFAKGKLAVIPQ